MPYPSSRPDAGLTFTPTRRHDTYPAIDPKKRDCRGKFVLITGAGKGMGRSVAHSYAQAGASGIAVTARNQSEADTVCDEVIALAQQTGHPQPQVLPLQVDLCDGESVQNAASAIQKQWGRLDTVINNAAYLDPFVPLADSDESGWWRTWEVNVLGLYRVTKALLPLLLQQENDGDRTIVNVSSVGALALTPGASAYQVSKLAVMRLTEYLMVDYFDQGLLSYSVHPASVATDLASRMPASVVKAVCVDTPELAGDTIVWLTSERREWLAGRYISCAWDMTEFLARKDEVVERDLLKLKLAV